MKTQGLCNLEWARAYGSTVFTKTEVGSGYLFCIFVMLKYHTGSK